MIKYLSNSLSLKASSKGTADSFGNPTGKRFDWSDSGKISQVYGGISF